MNDTNKEKKIIIRCGYCNNIIAVVEAKKYAKYSNPLEGITKCPHCGAQFNSIIIKSVKIL